MPEELNHHPEHHGEKLTEAPEMPSHDQREKHLSSENNEQDTVSETLNALRKHIETQAVSGKETHYDDGSERGGHHNVSPTHSLALHQQLKSESYKRTLTKVRSHLPTGERVLSRVVHQPAVEAVSEVAAKTIGRPYALLFGAIATLIGTAIVLYYAKHTGFRYNYTIFFLLFIGGFLCGLLMELSSKLPFIRKRDKYKS
jgi:hypothetical protein